MTAIFLHGVRVLQQSAACVIATADGFINSSHRINSTFKAFRTLAVGQPMSDKRCTLIQRRELSKEVLISVEHEWTIRRHKVCFSIGE